MYKLKITIANIEHKSWWWNGKSFYEFNTIDNLIDFMTAHMPMSNRNIDSMRAYDEIKNNGRLSYTHWYEVEKNEHKIMECISF